MATNCIITIWIPTPIFLLHPANWIGLNGRAKVSLRPNTTRIMFKKGSKIYSIFALKCPRCHEGEMFETGSWAFVKPFDMLKKCPHCQLDYEPEPGYFYGAMFISYIWTAWVCLLGIMLFHWYLGWSLPRSFAVLGLITAVNFVYIFRISRAMWLNINVKYEP